MINNKYKFLQNNQITLSDIKKARSILLSTNNDWKPITYKVEKIAYDLKKIYNVNIDGISIQNIIDIANKNYDDQAIRDKFFKAVFEICGLTDKIMINGFDNEFVPTSINIDGTKNNVWIIQNKKRNNLIMWNTNELKTILGFNSYPELVYLFEKKNFNFIKKDYGIYFKQLYDAKNAIEYLESIILANKLFIENG